MYRKILNYINKARKKEWILKNTNIRNFLPENPIIVEAGAYDGYDSIQMANYWPDSMIHAFEPLPKLFSVLKQNTKQYNNINCYNVALGDSIGAKNMHVSSGDSDASSSLLPPKDHREYHPEVVFNEIVNVETITIDRWKSRNKIKKVDFLWLDMQGFEFQTLKSSIDTLKDVKAIFSEVHLIESYSGVLLYPDYKKWLANKGFKVEFEQLYWSDSGNVLFVKDT